jgi:biopolymer transport protein ExbB/TolQ
MGKPERQGKRSSGADILLILAAVLMLAAICLAVYIIPRIGKTAADYRTLSAELDSTEAALAEEQAQRDAKLEEKMQLEAEDEEIKALRAETFELAAKLEKQIKAGKSGSRICYLTIDDGPYYRGKKLLVP